MITIPLLRTLMCPQRVKMNRCWILWTCLTNWQKLINGNTRKLIYKVTPRKCLVAQQDVQNSNHLWGTEQFLSPVGLSAWGPHWRRNWTRFDANYGQLWANATGQPVIWPILKYIAGLWKWKQCSDIELVNTQNHFGAIRQIDKTHTKLTENTQICNKKCAWSYHKMNSNASIFNTVLDGCCKHIL